MDNTIKLDVRMRNVTSDGLGGLVDLDWMDYDAETGLSIKILTPEDQMAWDEIKIVRGMFRRPLMTQLKCYVNRFKKNYAANGIECDGDYFKVQFLMHKGTLIKDWTLNDFIAEAGTDPYGEGVLAAVNQRLGLYTKINLNSDKNMTETRDKMLEVRKHFRNAGDEFCDAEGSMINAMHFVRNGDIAKLRHHYEMAKEAAEDGLRELENGMRALKNE